MSWIKIFKTILVGIIIYITVSSLLNYDFIIKISLIVFSILAHVYSHKIIGKILKIKKNKLFDVEERTCKYIDIFKKSVYCLSGVIANLIILLFCGNSDVYYFNYLYYINFFIIGFSLIPIKITDTGILIEILIKNFCNKEKVYKTLGISRKVGFYFLYLIGFIQIILFFNFSILLLTFIMKRFNKLDLYNRNELTKVY